MPINRDIFLTDPVTAPLPNDGVAEVVVPRTKEQWDVLRFEVSSFVCEGEYRRGLERILSTYLGHLTQPKQPAVWVSGFYGSGKSHFVRVLEYLWRDISFSDGSSARGLARLPTEIQDLLRELSTAGLRKGGLWSAAGTLAAGAGSVRLALLAIVFRSAGLPEQYPLARFVLWLRRSAAIQRVEEALQAAGTDLNTELENFYVSPPLAQALVDTGVLPRQDLAEVQSLLVAQYPPEREEISDDEFLRALEDVLALQSTTPGRLPCTLIVFDELQQFISEDPQRTLHVQNVVEACSSRFGSRILFVATGQASLQGTPQLSKLQGRFTVRVMLSDTDVEQVVRQVVLRKKPAAEPTIRTTLAAASGEIDRHLAGTRIGARPDDGADLVADYPLLPVRRRFWERVLRAIDSAGTAGQLRNQLRIVHEAARITASSPLGTVVGADFIYGQQQPYMLQSSVLLRDIANGIAEQADGTPEGLLRSRLCALVFLIGKLPTEGVAATGLSATADSLADLLVEDLSAGSASLRQRIPAQLERLVEAGTLMLVGDEYRLQTRESQEWEGEYRRRLADILNDESRISGDRTAELRAAVSALRKGGALIHGASKTPRKFDFAFGADPPPTDTDVVPVWVRDESQLTLRAFQDEARAVGTESPIVFVFLPRHRNPDALRRALASYAAARETLNARPSPSMPEGIEARNAMQSRIDMERRRLDSLLAEILADATVLKGGGSQVSEPALQESIRVAVEGALVRLFPNFALADHPGWAMVVTRAGNGAVDALSAVGFSGDVAQHPACREVRAFLGGAGRKGGEVRRRFIGAGYGWPQDAVDGVLLTLVAVGQAHAARNGQPQRVSEILRSQIGQTDFISEGLTVTTSQRIALRKLVADLGLPVKSGEESGAVPLVLQRLIDLAAEAGDQAPCPPRPDTSAIERLRGLSGNEQLIATYEQREELLARFQRWTRDREQIARRLPVWQQLQRLLRHAARLPVAAETAPQVEAILSNRALLAEPDPTPPLAARLADELRAALQSARSRLAEAHAAAMASLEASDEWCRLPDEQCRCLVERHGLGPVAALQIATDDALLAALDALPLADWDDKVVALEGRVARARAEAARLLEPQAVAVQLPHGTLRSPAEVEAYLAALRIVLMEQIDAGHPVIV